MAHAKNIFDIHGRPSMAMGGAPSEQGWRDEFARGGIAVMRPPFADVELGIDAVYGLLKGMQIKIFSDLKKLRSELESYSREVNEAGEVVSIKIEDKNKYHRVDALRYLSILLAPYLKSYSNSDVAVSKVVRGADRENSPVFKGGVYVGHPVAKPREKEKRPSGVVFCD